MVPARLLYASRKFSSEARATFVVNFGVRELAPAVARTPIPQRIRSSDTGEFVPPSGGKPPHSKCYFLVSDISGIGHYAETEPEGRELLAKDGSPRSGFCVPFLASRSCATLM